MSLKANDIAAWFVAREAMNHDKLQSLLYLAYAWYETLYHQPLFETEGFEALPVMIAEMSIFRKYHHYGLKRISKIAGKELPKEITIFLKSVYDTYSQAQGVALRTYLCQSTPYLKARQRIDFKIMRDDMRNYYEKQSQDRH